jgi:hypothetical protein
MEHLVRVHNEWDRQTLLWLRTHFGDAAIEAAVGRYGGQSKPYLSSVCRVLGVTPPPLAGSRSPMPTEAGERSLARIRHILAAKAFQPTN